MKIKYLVGLLLVASLFAQDKPAAPDKPILANSDSQVKILQAEHKLDGIVAQENQIQIQFAQIQNQYRDLESKRGEATKDVNAALAEVYKANNLSEQDYNFDPANMTFSKKPPVAPKK